MLAMATTVILSKGLPCFALAVKEDHVLLHNISSYLL